MSDTTGTITFVGYGSLLSKQSALTTSPNLTNFRFGVVRNYRRIFNKVGVLKIGRHIYTDKWTYRYIIDKNIAIDRGYCSSIWLYIQIGMHRYTNGQMQISLGSYSKWPVLIQ